MNIFKVLASGKKSFQEEAASAILAWLLNPTMEHGLGYTFIANFTDVLSTSTNNEKRFSELSKKLVSRLRSEEKNQDNFWIDLEYNVGNAVIDIVIRIEDWIFAIENKIYQESTTKGQLVKQYEGLKKKVPNSKIGIIYLVPIDENSEILNARTENIFSELSVKSSDFKVLITWQKNAIDNTPSISELIEKTLDDESKGRMDPIPEYTRHTLKALNAFISNNFSGYEYDRITTSSGGDNPLTEKRVALSELRQTDEGYVGVNYMVRGLLRMQPDVIEKYQFQYTTQDMSNKRNWIEIQEFKAITRWILDRTIEDINWKGKFTSESLYKIANDYKKRVFIGIKGGVSALRAMQPQVIRNKEWQISSEQSNAQWIDGELFCEILKEKGVY